MGGVALAAGAAILARMPGGGENRGQSVMSAGAAQRFLRQTTFGPTPEDVEHVRGIGFRAWITEQMSLPASDYAAVRATDDFAAVQKAFFTNALLRRDQLRQRVAWAFSQILVISGQKIDNPRAMASYQQMLLKNAFGNYRTLLREVTLHPAMGAYLDMVDNVKADPAAGSSPNENFAREVMQLFSIGLVKLNPDGTPIQDAAGKPQPAYTQDIVEGFARAFTGWTYATAPGAAPSDFNPAYYLAPMEIREEHHETGEKLLLDGRVLPAGQGTAKDLDDALDTIFNHSNVGPFIGYRLIQALVKSNPSPDYVQRVAAVFADNGKGVRGDLAAVVRAILLDVEARAGDWRDARGKEGKIREPVLRVTTVLRALHAVTDGDGLNDYTSNMGQDVFNAPSVFNYYPPNYRPAGQGFTAPEGKLVTSAATVAWQNFVFDAAYANLPTNTPVSTNDFGMAAGDPDQLAEALNQRLLGGAMSRALRSLLVQCIPQAGADPGDQLSLALYIVCSSPELQVQA